MQCGKRPFQLRSRLLPPRCRNGKDVLAASVPELADLLRSSEAAHNTAHEAFVTMEDMRSVQPNTTDPTGDVPGQMANSNKNTCTIDSGARAEAKCKHPVLDYSGSALSN